MRHSVVGLLSYKKEKNLSTFKSETRRPPGRKTMLFFFVIFHTIIARSCLSIYKYLYLIKVSISDHLIGCSLLCFK